MDGIGPQAQVDAEDVAVAGAVLQHAGERLREPGREGLGLDAVGFSGSASGS